MRITRKVFSIYSESDLIDEISERAFCQGYLAAEEEERLFAKIKDQKKQANRIAKLEKELLKAQSDGQRAKIQAELDAARKRYKMEVEKASGSTNKLINKEIKSGNLETGTTLENLVEGRKQVERPILPEVKRYKSVNPEKVDGKALKTIVNSGNTVKNAHVDALVDSVLNQRSKQAKKDSRASGVNKDVSNLVHDRRYKNAVNRAQEERSKIAAEKAARQEAFQPQIQHQLEKERIAAEELKRQQQIQQEAAKKADSVLGSIVPKPAYSNVQAPLADPRQTEVLRAKQEAVAKAQQETAAKAQQEAAALKSQEEKAGKSILGKVKELASSKAGKIGLGTAGAAGLGYGIYKYKNRNND